MPATAEGASWRELRARAERELRAAGVPDPGSEARWMVEQISGYEGAELVASEAEPVPTRGEDNLTAMLERRAGGEPLQYVLGEWSFRRLDLLVDRRVLIPRPETEVTAEVAIEEAQRLGGRRGAPNPWTGTAAAYTIADLGTGSGALALALAAELPDAEVWATDASEDALAVARANLAGAGQPAIRVRLARGDWFDALPAEIRGRLRMVVANPPYVSEAELAGLSPDVREHEPVDALVSGPTGLEAIEVIVADAPAWLEPGGALVCELAPHQRDAAIERARNAGFAETLVRPDLTGRDRVLVARLG
ncbi:MAG: peptide chain release factor N(5)-glutamine methyltransferase [Acidimicrobiia bacterium]